MTEERVGLLYKIANSIPKQTNLTSTLLRSYYLVRCCEITRNYGLPSQQFSPNKRCPNCCIEWKVGDYETKIMPVKLNKRQKRLLKAKSLQKTRKQNVQNMASEESTFLRNKLQRTCSLCKHTSEMILTKPVSNRLGDKHYMEVNGNQTRNNTPAIKTNSKTTENTNQKNKKEINVYSNTKDIFSLNNKNNTLASSIKKPPKVIKNNKKKKDKFAGLCQKAVLASAKLSEENKKKSKLDLFLKKSS